MVVLTQGPFEKILSLNVKRLTDQEKELGVIDVSFSNRALSAYWLIIMNRILCNLSVQKCTFITKVPFLKLNEKVKSYKTIKN